MFKNLFVGVAIAAIIFSSADAHSHYHHRLRHDNELTSDNYYINVDGRIIHGPSRTRDGHQPSGATAKCADGTWSFSQHHSGTCSHHGGVSEWF